MKTLKILLVLFAVILSGFSRDSQVTKAKVTVPIKFDGVIITDPSAPDTECSGGGTHASSGWLEGHQSHGGRLITEQSTWTIPDCSTDISTMTNTSNIYGINTVANGDTYSYKCEMLANIATGAIMLYVHVLDGTGRFEGVKGEITLSGNNTGSGLIPVSGWGFLILTK